MASLYVLLLFVIFDPGCCYTLGDELSEINFPTEYNLKGEETNYFTGIIKPFEAWYSAVTNKSRIDYYDGMVKKYYIGENSENVGTLYKIYPKSAEDLFSEFVCVKEDQEGLFNLLEPDEYYEYVGETVYNDKTVQIWELSDTDVLYVEKKVTLYVYLEENQHIPVLKTEISHNYWTGALSLHIVTRYYDFQPLSLDDLDIVEACNDTVEAVQFQHERFSHVDDEFFSFKMQHNKKYKGDEHEKRKQIFNENLRQVIEHNQKNLAYKLTINKFSDYTAEELALLGGTRPSGREEMGTMAFPYSEEEVETMVQDLPESYDMRIEGFISSVKNKGRCGSGWAFATTAAVEGALARKNGAWDLDLSEQSLIDCAWGYSNSGCEGGTMSEAYKYVLKHGIPTEEDYGLYLEENGFCKMNYMDSVYRISGFSRVPALSVNAMKVALYKYGPVTVTISKYLIVNYRSGIFYDPQCNKDPVDHTVTVVGYGVQDGASYWIVKNSWGEDWGQDGYILFSTTNNNCHILEEAYYPII